MCKTILLFFIYIFIYINYIINNYNYRNFKFIFEKKKRILFTYMNKTLLKSEFLLKYKGLIYRI